MLIDTPSANETAPNFDNSLTASLHAYTASLSSLTLCSKAAPALTFSESADLIYPLTLAKWDYAPAKSAFAAVKDFLSESNYY